MASNFQFGQKQAAADLDAALSGNGDVTPVVDPAATSAAAVQVIPAITGDPFGTDSLLGTELDSEAAAPKFVYQVQGIQNYTVGPYTFTRGLLTFDNEADAVTFEKLAKTLPASETSRMRRLGATPVDANPTGLTKGIADSTSEPAAPTV